MDVLLVHGLGRTPLSMMMLGRSLRAAGHRPSLFGYVAAVERYEAIVGRLVRRMSALAAGGPYAAVGHSLGGLLLRDAIGRLASAPARPSHLVMVATPNRVPRLAPRAARWWPFRVFTGDCGTRLADAGYFASLAPPTVPVSIIIGDSGPRGRWSPFEGEANDGIVSVEECRLAGAVQEVRVPRLHTWISQDRAVSGLVMDALGPRGP
jgi:hypothetical protein